jgi:hypothetical protein
MALFFIMHNFGYNWYTIILASRFAQTMHLYVLLVVYIYLNFDCPLQLPTKKDTLYYIISLRHNNNYVIIIFGDTSC